MTEEPPERRVGAVQIWERPLMSLKTTICLCPLVKNRSDGIKPFIQHLQGPVQNDRFIYKNKKESCDHRSNTPSDLTTIQNYEKVKLKAIVKTKEPNQEIQ